MNQDIKILPLTLNNYPRWISLVTKAATIGDVEHFLQQNAPLPADATDTQTRNHKKAQACASIIIEQSLSRDAITLLGTNYQNETPYNLLQKIKPVAASSTSADKRELRQRAEQLKRKDRMTIAERMLKHMKLRNKMIIAECDGMDDERKTAQYILDGIEQHPDYEPHIKPLSIRPPLTMSETKEALLEARRKIARSQAHRATSLHTRGAPCRPWQRLNRGNPRNARG